MRVFFNAKIGRKPNTATKGYFQKTMDFNDDINPLIIREYYREYIKKLEELYKDFFVTELGIRFENETLEENEK